MTLRSFQKFQLETPWFEMKNVSTKHILIASKSKKITEINQIEIAKVFNIV